MNPPDEHLRLLNQVADALADELEPHPWLLVHCTFRAVEGRVVITDLAYDPPELNPTVSPDDLPLRRAADALSRLNIACAQLWATGTLSVTRTGANEAVVGEVDLQDPVPVAHG